ncbi:MAG: CoA transferase [Alphaproteobacteria bacterium]|nr:CoA transferase [Alphaproteobacteria bacterium]
MDNAPLAGIRVIEVAQNIAGPICGQILAQLGADVVKVERPGSGDDARGWGPPFITDGTSTTFVACNRGKRSLVLDLKRDAAKLDALCATADVFVQNMRPGMLEEIGLGADTLCAKHPRLVYAGISAFGHTGPRAMEGGYEPILQGYSGLMMMNGEEGGPPTRTSPQILDIGTGLWAALGVVAALHRRRDTGRGGRVDASLLETALGWMGPHFAGFSVSGQNPKRHLSGNPNTVVFQAFATATQPIMVAAANDRLFVKLCGVMGICGDDPRFATNRLRVANKAALLAMLEPRFAAQPADHWLGLLNAAGVPCGPVNTISAMAVDAQVAALGALEAWGEVTATGLPINLDGRKPRAERGAPAIGEHTAEILREAGLD